MQPNPGSPLSLVHQQDTSEYEVTFKELDDPETQIFICFAANDDDAYAQFRDIYPLGLVKHVAAVQPAPSKPRRWSGQVRALVQRAFAA